MFEKNTQKEKTQLEVAIERIFSEMSNVEVTSQDYNQMTFQLERLYKLIGTEKSEPKTWDRVEKLLPVVGNLAGIIAILGFERTGVVASKALGFVTKTKL